MRPACPVIEAEDGSCDLGRWRPGTNGALFSPQGGPRISANGLARIGRILLNGGMLDGVRVLSADSVRALATPVDACRDDPFGDGIPRVGHSGSAYGLQAGLWPDLTGGRGVAWYATGMPGERLGGKSAFSAVEEALAQP